MTGSGYSSLKCWKGTLGLLGRTEASGSGSWTLMDGEGSLGLLAMTEFQRMH